MKYLRRIFESLTEDEIIELREECETYLAYLLDEDFIIEMISDSRIACEDIDIRKLKSADEDQFLWYDVKDHVIPLIELFKKGHFKYKLNEVVFYYADGDKREFLRYLVNEEGFFDKLVDTEELICLTIRIKI
jgi:hypothetical protein